MLRMDFTSQPYLRHRANGLAKLRAAGPVVAVRFTTESGCDRRVKHPPTVLEAAPS